MFINSITSKKWANSLKNTNYENLKDETDNKNKEG